MKHKFHILNIAVVLLLVSCGGRANKDSDATTLEVDTVSLTNPNQSTIGMPDINISVSPNDFDAPLGFLTKDEIRKYQINKLFGEDIADLSEYLFTINKTLLSSDNAKVLLIKSIKGGGNKPLDNVSEYIASYDSDGNQIDHVYVAYEEYIKPEYPNCSYKTYSKIENNVLEVYYQRLDHKSGKLDKANLIAKYRLASDLMFCDENILNLISNDSPIDISQTSFYADCSSTDEKGLSKEECRKLQLDEIPGIQYLISEDYTSICLGETIYTSDKGKLQEVIGSDPGGTSTYLISYNNESEMIAHLFISDGDCIDGLTQTHAIIREDIIKIRAIRTEYESGVISSDVSRFYRITPNLEFELVKETGGLPYWEMDSSEEGV